MPPFVIYRTVNVAKRRRARLHPPRREVAWSKNVQETKKRAALRKALRWYADHTGSYKRVAVTLPKLKFLEGPE